MTTTINLDSLTQRYFDYIYARDLASERYKAMSAAERQPLIDSGMDQCRVTLTSLLASIEARDVGQLSKKLHRHNRFFLSVFREATGINLGKTDKTIRSTLREYCGPEKWDTHFHLATAQAEQAKADREAAAEKRRRESALSESCAWPVETPSGVVEKRRGTWQDFVDWAIQEGYTPLETKRGFSATVTLSRPLGDGQWSSGYVLQQKYHCEYARERFAAKVCEQTPAA